MLKTSMAAYCDAEEIFGVGYGISIVADMVSSRIEPLADVPVADLTESELKKLVYLHRLREEVAALESRVLGGGNQ